MKGIKIIFWIIWRIWFYVLMAIPILLMLPFLLASIITESGYPYFFRMARIWAKIILFGMGFYYKIDRDQKLERGKSYMIVANHTSMTDIMLMLVVAKNPFVFVGKKELSKIPLFGFFYKRTCILVDRNSSKSKNEVFKRAQSRLNQGLSICIFPEGGVPDDESILLDEFKDGAFRLAIEHQIPIVPVVFADNKERFSYTFMSGSPGKMRVKVLPFIATKDLSSENRKDLRDQVRQLIYKQLLVFKKEDLK
ncbi:lysophospholipid acyltransferase family protein [Flavobacterium sp. Fl-77]|uniref:1-acyl-sn-glycerol-3-phosphate acyltransferase n=1 Tax=Flavobacterium flavipigmentatum TaxID=2893884 RepID=A0AAJ2VVW7_9FLAO|nr:MULTISPECIES: lysophospholipid acyltransferase family protein [unclassified Flavobacterium]MDX6180942.1 lysophospholipid acyltransferase family protein [Flavobacterium sp. Fl-33]MDX6184543.1 lysophospholipid acyltransferase family protein [Flavobacterium sp. Fl-77]UFH39648.1 1-acyl-sn-glycerol-3-phosphate acyltransferase [Flavobacterium sp. F-70]